MGKAAGRVMGIDFGTRHIGIAVSDELRVIAKGRETVNWNGEDPEWALNRICEIIKEMEVNAIVLGMPARTDGTRSATQDKAEEFGAELAKRCGIEPVYKDERFTPRHHRWQSISTNGQQKVRKIFSATQ